MRTRTGHRASRLRMTAIVVSIAALLLAGCTTPPFREASPDEGLDLRVGTFEEAVGDEYSLTADRINERWIFTRTTTFELHFDGGTVAFDGSTLEPGCWAAAAGDGQELSYRNAEGVEFRSPAPDSACSAIGA